MPHHLASRPATREGSINQSIALPPAKFSKFPVLLPSSFPLYLHLSHRRGRKSARITARCSFRAMTSHAGANAGDSERERIGSRSLCLLPLAESTAAIDRFALYLSRSGSFWSERGGRAKCDFEWETSGGRALLWQRRRSVFRLEFRRLLRRARAATAKEAR